MCLYNSKIQVLERSLETPRGAAVRLPHPETQEEVEDDGWAFLWCSSSRSSQTHYESNKGWMSRFPSPQGLGQRDDYSGSPPNGNKGIPKSGSQGD